MNKLGLLSVIIFVIFVGMYFFSTQGSKILTKTKPSEFSTTPLGSPTNSPSPEVDYSAGFAIITNGTVRIFSAPMYHNLSDEVFIQADNPNVVHIKKTGVTWNDFFDTLPLKLTKECLITGTKQTFCTNTDTKLRFSLNGIENTNALDTQIEAGDQLLVTFGNDIE